MSYNPANPFDFMFSGGNRSYNKVGDQKQTVFNQVFNPHYDNGAGISGQWQPITTDDQGALRVNIGTGINVTATITGLTMALDNVAVTGGNIDVNGFSTLTGQVAQLQTAVNTLTGTVSSKWQKIKTAGYATVFGAVTGNHLINKVQGYTKTTTQPSYIQLFDSSVAPINGAIPDFIVSVQTVNNWFIDLAEAGVEFTNGLQIVNSSTPDSYTALGASDFIASVVYK